MWFAAYKITGLVAGNTITVTLSTAFLNLVTTTLFVEDFGATISYVDWCL
jgi:hypothetical protein